MRVPRRGELLRHHVAQVHQVVEALFECFNGCGGVCVEGRTVSYMSLFFWEKGCGIG